MHMKGCLIGTTINSVVIGTVRVHIPYHMVLKFSRVYTIVDSTYNNLFARLIEGCGAEDFSEEYMYLCKKIGYKGEPNDAKLLQYFVENEDLHDFWLL